MNDPKRADESVDKLVYDTLQSMIQVQIESHEGVDKKFAAAIGFVLAVLSYSVSHPPDNQWLFLLYLAGQFCMAVAGWQFFRGFEIKELLAIGPKPTRLEDHRKKEDLSQVRKYLIATSILAVQENEDDAGQRAGDLNRGIRWLFVGILLFVVSIVIMSIMGFIGKGS